MRRSGFVLAGAIGFGIAMSGAMGLAQAAAVQPNPAAGPAVGTAAANGSAAMLLWPEGAPGALGVADEDKPSITVYLPAANPTRTAVVIAPGGGYQHLSMVREGSDVAAWLNARGLRRSC